MLAIGLGELRDGRVPPAMHRDLEGCAGLETRNKTSHDRHVEGSMDVGELQVRHHMAANPELLEGNLAVPTHREEDDVPVVVTHVGDGSS